MSIVIVPNELHDAIHAAITEALHGRPCEEWEREEIYSRLLAYFNEHGRIPDFTLGDKPDARAAK